MGVRPRSVRETPQLIAPRSIRAWRELRYNKRYAEKLERKQARLKEKAAQQAESPQTLVQKGQARSNPFTVSAFAVEHHLDHRMLMTRFQLGASSPLSGPFGLGSQIFGGSDPTQSSEISTIDSSHDQLSGHDGSSDDSESGSEGEGVGDDDPLASAVQSVSLQDSPWKDAPAYSPLYLSTVSEYLPPPPKIKVPAEGKVEEDVYEESKQKDGSGWGPEGYENSIEVDHAFERFNKRVSYEGEQCLR